jgi:hypothetical protein
VNTVPLWIDELGLGYEIGSACSGNLDNFTVCNGCASFAKDSITLDILFERLLFQRSNAYSSTSNEVYCKEVGSRRAERIRTCYVNHSYLSGRPPERVFEPCSPVSAFL